tara:strand:+ start:1360 stop:1542 length:183 start_codon:yes stop_codon:yes gene_type:complete
MEDSMTKLNEIFTEFIPEEQRNFRKTKYAKNTKRGKRSKTEITQEMIDEAKKEYYLRKAE